MIHVTSRPEPPNFDKIVRQRGKRFLSSNPTPTSKQFQKKALWQNVIKDLHAAYGSICAYTCYYIISDPSVDHFLPKSRYPNLAYEWSNYRLARQLVNHHKGDSMEVLDPFTIQTGWFVLDFPSCLVRPSIGLPAVLTEQINKSIKILKINEHDAFVQERCDLMLAFAESNVSLNFLSERYPFLASEIIRQGIQHTASKLFKRRIP